MTPFQVIPSTTSHKREPLLPTLEVFARLGMRDLDLNLNHMVEGGTPRDAVRQALDANDQIVQLVSGGWCDFFDGAPQIEETFSSVNRQVVLTRLFGVRHLRLFFGRLSREACSPLAVDIAVDNIRRLSAQHPDILFAFENHGGGAAAVPDVCRAILEGVDRSNVRLNFDPINFEHAGVDSLGAIRELAHLTVHVHLKGLGRDGYCAFGEGDIDLTPVLRTLLDRGYRGAFTVEYEGTCDRTIRLYEGLRRARLTIAALTGQPVGGPARVSDRA